MSPQSNYGLIATVIGAFMSAMGHSEWQRRRVNRFEENVDKRILRIEKKVPSGDVTCASNEEVALIFKKLDEMAVQLTKTSTILAERLPKR